MRVKPDGLKRSCPGRSLVGALVSLGLLVAFPAPSVFLQAAAEAHLRKAVGALQAGDLAAAEAEFEKVVALEPSDVDARANLAAVRFLRGNWAKAAEGFREVLRLRPTLIKAKAMLGMCERRLGRPDEARGLLESAFADIQEEKLRTQAGLELVELYYQVGTLDRAAEVVRLLRETSPTNVDVLFAAYRVFTDLADGARQTLALLAPDSARMHHLLAQHFINQGHVRSAIHHYRKALEIDPRLPGARYELGQALLLESLSDANLKEAERLLLAALDEAPLDPNAACWLAKVYELRFETEAAERYYRQALTLQADHASALIGLGDILVKKNRLEEALKHYQLASRSDALNPTARLRLAGIHRMRGDLAEARREFAIFRDLEEKRDRLRRLYLSTARVRPEEISAERQALDSSAIPDPSDKPHAESPQLAAPRKGP